MWTGVRVSFNLICCQCARNTKLLFSFNYLSIFHFGKLMRFWCATACPIRVWLAFFPSMFLLLLLNVVSFIIRYNFPLGLCACYWMYETPKNDYNYKLDSCVDYLSGVWVWVYLRIYMLHSILSIDLVSVIFHLWSGANHQCTQSISRIIALIYRVNGWICETHIYHSEAAFTLSTRNRTIVILNSHLHKGNLSKNMRELFAKMKNKKTRENPIRIKRFV